MGSLHEPGPGFVFFWTAVVVGLLSLGVVAQSFVGKAVEEENEGRIFTKAGARKVALVVIALFLYALLLEWVGFVIVTLLLMVFLLRVIEKKPWWLTLLTAVTITVVAYLVFEMALQSNLPKGLLEHLGF
jgi:putative tricarboxylic transport membrane protein